MASAALAIGVVASIASAAPAATAAPAKIPARPVLDALGDGHGPRDKDNRAGAIGPNAKQQARAAKVGAVRWNSLGTPHAVGPAKALATGLPADPEAAARAYLGQNQDLYGLDAAAVAALQRVQINAIGTGSAVLLRQRFGDLPAGYDGLVMVLVRNGTVLRVTSSLSRDTSSPAPATLTPADAFAAALRDAGLTTDQVATSTVDAVAVPTPAQGPRAAYAVTVIGKDTADPSAYTTYVDARTGSVLVREDLVDFDSDNPTWAVFPATPPSSIPAGTDPRVHWCLNPQPGCVKQVHDAASGQAWDVNLSSGTPTFTSSGNSANNVVLWGGGIPATPATPSPNRSYTYPFTDQWHAARCNPAGFTSAQRNDADAAVSNLFAMHNRMHDFAYQLGFDESAWNLQAVNLSGAGLGGDAEQGRAQSGALSGSRNNANQGTPRDGLQPTTNMFLWQPVAGAAYPPCVDGDYDMTVIGHEYTHAITNRMIGGPDNGISGFEGGSMGEAWGDLTAAEYLYENGLRAPGDTPFVTGAYVTGNNTVGIRNYDGSQSPLNFSDIGYDLVGPEVHADGEIWVATNLRVRAAFVDRYGVGTPAVQAQCADGALAADACPGNRRWIQLMFDSFLLQADGNVSMVDMRDNMLAADLVRFGGANQDLIWHAFAESGLGQDAVGGPSDVDPTPSFASPYASNATVTLSPQGDAATKVVRLYVGDYEARAVPVADTDPETAIPDTFQILPNTTFHFTAEGPGLGARKFSTLFLPGRAQALKLNLPTNLASTSAGATASGDGVNLGALTDDSEGTDWASLDGVSGKQVTVHLAGTRPQLISVANVSALLRPAIPGNADPLAQNRFSALRSFQILSCNATLVDCAQDANYHVAYQSAADAFPGAAFRPVASELNLRTFHFTPTLATHVRLRVLTSQCTGNPQYAGEQDNDPAAATDCTTASPFATQVRVAEFQLFTR
jgi:hypothetical protein